MDLIKEINEKYQALEAEIDKKLEKAQAEEQKLERQNERLAEKTSASQSPKVLSYEEALQRNANTLKSLEIAKARLRSRSTYSPVEKLLQRALENYKKELASLSKQQVTPKMTRGSQDNIDQLVDHNIENRDQDEEVGKNIYDMVMQNAVLESSSIRKQGGESHRN